MESSPENPSAWVALARGAVLLFALAPSAAAGGGPTNVLVLYNADVRHPGELDDPYEIAELYRALRCLPRTHLVPVHGLAEARMGGGGFGQAHTISVEEYEEHVLAALDGALAALPYPEDLDTLVVVRGLPYRVDLEPDASVSNDCASLTAMLGVYRTQRVDLPGDFLYDEPHPLSSFPPHRRPSVENPWWTGGVYVSGDYPAGDPAGPAAMKYTTATTIARRDLDAGEAQVASFRRATSVPVPLVPPVWDFDGNLFLVTRLDGFDYDDARALALRGVAADGAFAGLAGGLPCARDPCGPSHGAPTFVAMAGRDGPRQLRDSEARFALEHLAPSFCAEYVAPHEAGLAGRSLAALFTGSDKLATHFPAQGDALSGNCFAPGALACNLTSNAAAPQNFFCDADGDCPPFDDGVSGELQSSVARLIRHGVTGAHATVAEPFSHTFPGVGTLLYYTFGYNLVESFFFAQPYLHWQNTYFGDPLATPYAERPVVTLGTTNLAPNERLTVSASHPHGIARIRVYVDGLRRADEACDSGDSSCTFELGLLGLDLGAHELLVVAQAFNALTERPGWPEPWQLPQPDVQGWTCATLRIEVPERMRESELPPAPR